MLAEQRRTEHQLPKKKVPAAPFAARLAAHRRLIRDRIRERLERRRLVLFEGDAVSAEEARTRYRAMERRQLMRLLELLALLGGLAGLVFLAWRMVRALPG